MRTYHLARYYQGRLFYVSPGVWDRDVEKAVSHTKEEWQPILEAIPPIHPSPYEYELVETFESIHLRAVQELNEEVYE